MKGGSTGRKHGRPALYPMGAVQKSLTLDAQLVERLTERGAGNLSQTVNDLLEQALDQEDLLAAAQEMAAAYGVAVDPEVEARATAFLLAAKAPGGPA